MGYTLLRRICIRDQAAVQSFYAFVLSWCVLTIHWLDSLVTGDIWCLRTHVSILFDMQVTIFAQLLCWAYHTPWYVGVWYNTAMARNFATHIYPESKVHEAYMGPAWGRQDPSMPHVGPVNLVIRVIVSSFRNMQSNWNCVVFYNDAAHGC